MGMLERGATAEQIQEVLDERNREIVNLHARLAAAEAARDRAQKKLEHIILDSCEVDKALDAAGVPEYDGDADYGMYVPEKRIELLAKDRDRLRGLLQWYVENGFGSIHYHQWLDRVNAALLTERGRL